MKVKGLNGHEYSWRPKCRKKNDCSTYHLRARQLLERLFPSEQRLEEVLLPGTGGLRADFFIPLRKVLIEVHGEQHYGFVPHFHRHEWNHVKSRGRDIRKHKWAQANQIIYIGLPYYESDDQWRNRILADHNPSTVEPTRDCSGSI